MRVPRYGRPAPADQRQKMTGSYRTALRPRLIVEQQVLGEVEDDAAHPVVGEPLPHLGENRIINPGWVFSTVAAPELCRQRDEDPQQDNDIHEGGSSNP